MLFELAKNLFEKKIHSKLKSLNRFFFFFAAIILQHTNVVHTCAVL